MGARMLGFARRGNLQLSLAHTLRLSDTAKLAAGQRSLDLLNGDVLSESTALPKQEWELQFGGARNGYNNTVQGYNQTLVVFPTNLLAGLFGFKAMPFFQVDDAAQRVAPQVKF